MNMMSMRLEKLRQADLNLLITFAAIAEEKSITAAASRLFLSQPAVSRALQRARAMFQDDFWFDRPMASNSPCEVERFSTSLRN
jgi:Bacterial regulatory helix-turn-helix protein, lysR family